MKAVFTEFTGSGTGHSVSGGGPASVLGYDSAGRLSTVDASGSIHTHGYIPGTGILASLATTTESSTVLTRTLHHDRMQRLRGIATANATGVVLSRHGYTLDDDAGRRKTATRENGQRWDYGYDTLGQVTSAVKRFPNDSAIPGYTYGYGYDGIGNRTSAVNGGTGTAVTYTPNALNQYTSIATEGGRFILGEAPAADAVTVNSLTAARAGGLGFFWKQITGNNAANPLWSTDSVVSNSVTITGKTWTPKASVAPTYDEDGNLTSDGRWNYTWDAENRQTRMETTTAAATAGVPRQRLDFVYDSQGRRVSKTVSTSTDGTNWTFASNQRFLYDGWNLIAEYSAPSATSSSLTLQASHTWGIDLSGTPQGAGGVGGLLSSTLISQSPISNVPCFPAYDGNGNISAWIDGGGTLLGRMDYSPFGQLIAQYKFTAAGDTTLARLPFGFSTKYTDAESGLLYYGHRYYDPVNGRWPSRDPIEERGGVNLYGFVNNGGLNLIDLFGLFVKDDKLKKWVGQRGKYEGKVCAEEGDNSAGLMGLINGPQVTGFVGPPASFTVGQVVDVSGYLASLESYMRSNVVAATSKFSTKGPFVNPGDEHDPYEDYFKPNCTGAAECMTAANLVMAKGLSDSLFPGEFTKLFGGKVKSISGTRNTPGLMIKQIGLASDKDAFLGDTTWLQGYPLDEGMWGGENIIKVSDDKWWGWGGAPMNYSIGDWETHLRDHGDKGNGRYDIERFKPNAVFFLDVIKIAETVWKARGGH